MTTDKNKFMNISLQLKALLEGLTDNENKPIFESVLLGIPNSRFRGFRFPISIVRIKEGEYQTGTFNKRNTADWIHSSIGILTSGDAQESYCQAIKIMDLVQEKLETEKTWQTLNNTVRITEIERSLVDDIQSDELLVRIVIFDLKHHVYK